MRTSSRRAVLRLLLVGAGALAVPIGAAGSATGLTPGQGTTRLRRGVFLPHTGAAFLLVAHGRRHRAVLHAVTPLETGDRADDRRFSLLFRVPKRPAEGIYQVSSARLRGVDLFVTPVGPPGERWYEAVVSA